MADNKSIQSTAHEVSPPDFLNVEYFENILREAERDCALSITKLQIVPGTKPGDNFSSNMYKAIIAYKSRDQTNSISLIVKSMPVEEGLQKDILNEMPVFEREIDFYTKILPEMKRIMESIGDDDEITPRLIYHTTDPPILILDDLSSYGYEMHDGFFNFDNTLRVVRKLAKFHALSYYIRDNKYNHSVDLTKYTTIVTETMMRGMEIFYDGFDHLKDEVKNWPGFEIIAEKLGTQSATFIQRLFKAFQPSPNHEFNVLCHGDFHVRNMMFIKNGDDIDKAMFLDFQICCWGSPAIDLIFMFYALSDAECRERRGEIVFIYHKFLSDYLKQIGCLRKPPSLLELNIEMLRVGAIEQLMCVCFLPFFYLDFTKIEADVIDPSPEEMTKLRKIMYTNEEMVKILKKVLPELLYKGILY